ncbi:hypothetical protein DL766_009488 [Monosporascus sp. MC13-8B]|nr:hypothetical protein DL763_008760 [Monosporascus cannonballus]RYP15136.1 hypothetical protein DL766_009488 [Monosporascus sp. MC13-8B]
MTSVVGGGSVMNGMFADRGSKADYDAWGALGNEGWGWDGLLPYFCKSTNFTPPSPGIAEDFDIQWDPEAYGQGPLQIDFSSMLYPDLRVKMISRNDGIVRKAYASKEVVLAAGAISTPKLLQLSGIGTTITLEEAGVKVKKEFAAIMNQMAAEYLPSIYEDSPELLQGYKAQREILINHFLARMLLLLKYSLGQQQ